MDWNIEEAKKLQMERLKEEVEEGAIFVEEHSKTKKVIGKQTFTEYSSRSFKMNSTTGEIFPYFFTEADSTF